MTATCSQRKFLEAVKKFHCCPFSRVVSTAAAYFLFGPRFSLSLSLFLLARQRTKEVSENEAERVHKQKPLKKIPKIKFPSLSHIHQKRVETERTNTQNKGLTLDFTSSTGTSTSKSQRKGVGNPGETTG